MVWSCQYQHILFEWCMYLYNLLWNSIVTCFSSIATYVQCCMIATQYICAVQRDCICLTVHLCCEATYVRKLCLPRRALKGKHRGLQHPLFIRRVRRLPYAIESCQATSRRCHPESYGAVCFSAHLSQHHTDHTVPVWCRLLAVVFMGCCVAINVANCKVSHLLSHQLLIKSNNIKL